MQVSYSPLKRGVTRMICLLFHLVAWQAMCDAADRKSLKIQVDPTVTCLSIICDIDDPVSTSQVRLSFRRSGEEQWRDAVTPALVQYSGKEKNSGSERQLSRYAGSIFGLSPGTEYDVKLDVAGTQALTTAMTRYVPVVRPSREPIIVRNADDLVAKQKILQPGDVVLLQPGKYGQWRVSTGGAPGNPILYRPLEDGTVEFSGIRILTDDVWLDGFNVVGGGVSGYFDLPEKIQERVSLTRLVVSESEYAVNAWGEEWFVSDCVLSGKNKRGEGIEFRGSGHVAGFNDISNVFDGISYGERNIDIHNNAVHDLADDSIEPDYAWDNYRIWENRFWNAGQNGISFQPIQGGPWYFLRNQITGNTYNPIKLRSGKGARFFVGNTVVAQRAVQNFDRFFHPDGVFANNLWCVYQANGDGHLGYGKQVDPLKMRLWDYNRYDVVPNKIVKLNKVFNLKSLREIGYERHGYVIFARRSASNIPADLAAGTPRPILPLPGATLDGAGTSDAITGLANLVGPFLGKAPDIGAFQLGLGIPWTGPREFVPQLAFGVPTGWTRELPAALKPYQDLGAPRIKSGTRVILVNEAKQSFLVATFTPHSASRKWEMFDQYMANKKRQKNIVPRVDFRDGLAAKIHPTTIKGRRVAQFVGARVDDGGVLTIVGGVPLKGLESVQDDWFTFIRSLYYPWSI